MRVVAHEKVDEVAVAHGKDVAVVEDRVGGLVADGMKVSGEGMGDEAGNLSGL